MKIEIEESALDSLKSMAQKLQDERDELLEVLKEANRLLLSIDEIHVNSPFHRVMKSVIAKCTAKPGVLE